VITITGIGDHLRPEWLIIFTGMRTRTDETEATEVAIAAAALNRMLEFGRPNYVRIA
jgi:hypothetical protein